MFLVVFQDDVDDGIDIGNADFTVAVDVGGRYAGVAVVAAHDDNIDYAIGVTDSDLAVTVHVTGLDVYGLDMDESVPNGGIAIALHSTGGNMQGGSFVASLIETILCNERRRRHGLTSHARQRDAIIESIVVNRPGCAWNGHARQIAASGKCPIPYCFDLVGDDNALQSNTVREFATYCVPICFGKNGRKVISWILLRVNKMKI